MLPKKQFAYYEIERKFLNSLGANYYEVERRFIV